MKILSRRKVNVDDLPNILTIQTKVKRELREPILKAFDIYKSNVYYGIITESEAQHDEIIVWYQNLCDLNETALREIPAEIKKFL